MHLSSLGLFQIFNFKKPESLGKVIMLTDYVMDPVIIYLTAIKYKYGFFLIFSLYLLHYRTFYDIISQCEIW